MQYGAAHIAAQKLEDCRYEIMTEGVLLKCEGTVRKRKVQLQDEESDRVCAKVVGLHNTQSTQSGMIGYWLQCENIIKLCFSVCSTSQ